MIRSWGEGGTLHDEFELASARIPESVARNFRDGGGETGLILVIETEHAGDLPGTLARRDGIVFMPNLDR